MNWPIKLVAISALLCSLNIILGQTDDKIVFNEGVENYRKGQYQTAQKNFEAVVNTNPQNTRALFNAGNASFLNGDFEKAKTYFGNYVQAASAPMDKSRGFYNMGNVYLQEAMAAEANPQTSGQAQSNYKNAINSYKQSLKYNPNDADAKYNLTYAMNKLQQNQQNQQKDQNKDQQKDQQENKDNKENQDNKNNENKEGNKDSKPDDKKGDENKPNDQKGEKKENENKGSEGNKPDQKQQQKDAQAAKAQAIKDLDAINNDEKKILQKVTGSKASKSTESTLEKDW